MAQANRRIVAKALTWRVLSTSITFALAWWLTGNTVIAGQLAIINLFLKTFLHVIHDKIWEKIKWGKGKWLKKRKTKLKSNS